LRNAVKIFAAIALGIALGATAYMGLRNSFGTGLESRIAAVEKASARIDQLQSKASKMPASWSSLSLDETSEAEKILDDFNNNRGYKVDVLRNPAAAEIQKEIIAIESELKLAQKEEKSADKSLSLTYGYIPYAKRARFDRAKADAALAIDRSKALAENLQELRYDIDIWGFLSITLKINGLYTAKFDTISAGLAAEDYSGASAAAKDVLTGINESVTWLTHGKQELTNVGGYGKDTDPILSYISRAKTTAESFDNAAAAGLRGSPDQAKTGAADANEKLEGLKKTASDQSLCADFKTWYIKNAERRLKIQP
jgi:hypothetical protein